MNNETSINVHIYLVSKVDTHTKWIYKTIGKVSKPTTQTQKLAVCIMPVKR